MKNYEDMAKDVLHQIDEYENERKMKHAKMTKVVASVTPVCAAAVVGVGLWKGGALIPRNDQLISSTVELTASDVILSVDNDTSADKHSANPKNTTNRNDESATSASVADYQTTTFDATAIYTTENDESMVESSRADNDSVEADTPVADNKSAPVSDNSTIADDEPQRATEATVIQTEPSVQQNTPPVQETESETQINPDNSENTLEYDSNMWVTFRCTIEWNGITYNDNVTIDATAYSRDKYIGKVSDFNGEYKDSFGYRINPDDEVYTTKENTYVLIVVKANGTIIAMTNPAFLEGVVYRPHTEDVPYKDIQEWN